MTNCSVAGEASIIEMFQAAIIPGQIAVAFFIGLIALLVRRNPVLAPNTSDLSLEQKREAYSRLLPVILIFGSIILGLGMGFSTPTTAAGVGATIILI
ncbi:TRAP transporter large permease subunit [Aliiruegeria lutimaris]|uniref:Tripartite ATP-independent transporter, DctM component n=1 Tax=Aliiruegeria lutimaris TaxID=571298 RepID=A0A1G8UKB0_9RHOB|nr:TRAP transporter large permease subunit [Aliiruegeria lutimaris]SDJ54252.1 Tripartite ATP-independent transporter, DctM component [Aliiruegeria lutimaris]